MGELPSQFDPVGISDECGPHSPPQVLSVEATPSLKAVGDVPAIGFGCWDSVSGRGEGGAWSQTVRPGRGRGEVRLSGGFRSEGLDIDLASTLDDGAMSNLNPAEQSAGAPADVDPLDPHAGTAGRRRPEHPPATSATAGRTALAVEARGVRKSFGDQVVLDGIDLDVIEGTVFALLGPNGSGKTTTVRILSTLLAADAGVVRVAGHDVGREPDSVRAAIGVTGQFSAVDKLLTGRENLMMMADLAHLSRADGRRRAAELLDRFDLFEAAGKMAATYSGGMRRRLDLAMTLVGAPRIVFLDEPTTGLDPRGRHVMWQIIRGLAADGV